MQGPTKLTVLVVARTSEKDTRSIARLLNLRLCVVVVREAFSGEFPLRTPLRDLSSVEVLREGVTCGRKCESEIFSARVECMNLILKIFPLRVQMQTPRGPDAANSAAAPVTATKSRWFGADWKATSSEHAMKVAWKGQGRNSGTNTTGKPDSELNMVKNIRPARMRQFPNVSTNVRLCLIILQIFEGISVTMSWRVLRVCEGLNPSRIEVGVDGFGAGMARIWPWYRRWSAVDASSAGAG
ncbi:hypothetical protein B0H11DRAFT_2191419 [Mycena galericulata]|nr:hypothetical protein B0H11DRAFT_2191419 [Mycena galericulata]